MVKNRPRAVGKDTQTSEKKVTGKAVKAPNRGKRVKAPEASKPEQEEVFEDKRNLEDLWQAAFPVGTEWDQLDSVYQIKWNFSNLENAFEEGGVLHGKKVYLFGCTEPAQVALPSGEQQLLCIPAIIAVVSPFPPSEKIGVKSVQREKEEILNMKDMKMAWIPYVPLKYRSNQIERFKSQIYTLGCTQRRVALKHLKFERIKKFDYCLPYFYNPLKQDEGDEDTVVDIFYPIEPPVVCGFDWEMDDLEELADEKITDGYLPAEQKEGFKQFVRERVKEAKRAIREAQETRMKSIEEMDDDTKAGYENMKFIKFYPVETADTPDISGLKSAFINRYYGKAHQIL